MCSYKSVFVEFHVAGIKWHGSTRQNADAYCVALATMNNIKGSEAMSSAAQVTAEALYSPRSSNDRIA